LNSKHDSKNGYEDHTDKKTWVKYDFNTPAPLSGLGVVSIGKTFDYLHITIKYKDSEGKIQKRDMIRKP
jgi:hypothetical protein